MYHTFSGEDSLSWWGLVFWRGLVFSAMWYMPEQLSRRRSSFLVDGCGWLSCDMLNLIHISIYIRGNTEARCTYLFLVHIRFMNLPFSFGFDFFLIRRYVHVSDLYKRRWSFTYGLSGVPESAVISCFLMAGTPGTSWYVSPVHRIHHGMPLLSSVSLLYRCIWKYRRNIIYKLKVF